jgi:hypothetical protein
MIREIKLWLVSLFIKWAYSICPEGEFKVQFTWFITNHIEKL